MTPLTRGVCGSGVFPDPRRRVSTRAAAAVASRSAASVASTTTGYGTPRASAAWRSSRAASWTGSSYARGVGESAVSTCGGFARVGVFEALERVAKLRAPDGGTLLSLLRAERRDWAPGHGRPGPRTPGRARSRSVRRCIAARPRAAPGSPPGSSAAGTPRPRGRRRTSPGSRAAHTRRSSSRRRAAQPSATRRDDCQACQRSRDGHPSAMPTSDGRQTSGPGRGRPVGYAGPGGPPFRRACARRLR